ncbi:MAG TPA: hypothetical protein VKR79_01150 [Gaiellaceae bacterium]|nr:hypothetical protein [Gaiellaceae bacterium]
MSKRLWMPHDSTGWPIVDERPLARMRHPHARRARTRPVWLLTTLAFLCGGLVSAAVFTIGWRHQTQQNNAAETALVAATARNHTLTAALAAASRLEARDSRIATHRTAEAQSSARQLAQTTSRLARAATAVQSAASSSGTAADSVSSDAGGLATSAGKIANELKNLAAYLTTTPPRQIDAGYVASQATYLEHQLHELESSGGAIASEVASFQSAIQKVGRLASSLAGK